MIKKLILTVLVILNVSILFAENQKEAKPLTFDELYFQIELNDIDTSKLQDYWGLCYNLSKNENVGETIVPTLEGYKEFLKDRCYGDSEEELLKIFKNL